MVDSYGWKARPPVEELAEGLKELAEGLKRSP
jgi:hypothetical protein